MEKKPNYSFGKEKKLKSRVEVQRLFKEAKGFTVFPIRVLHLPKKEGDESPSKFAFSVPKSRFPKAVDRNRIRRKMKEVVRINQDDLSEKRINVIFIYISNEELEFSKVQAALIQGIKRIASA